MGDWGVCGFVSREETRRSRSSSFDHGVSEGDLRSQSCRSSQKAHLDDQASSVTVVPAIVD